AAPEAGGVEHVVGDAVVQHEAARLEQAIDLAEIATEATRADVLEHSHARDLVVEHVLGQLLVVPELDADATGEPARGNLAFDVPELMLRQRDARRVDAVALCGPEHEAAPAAADVEERLAGGKPELAADMVQLARLRIGERVVLTVEIGARV